MSEVNDDEEGDEGSEEVVCLLKDLSKNKTLSC